MSRDITDSQFWNASTKALSPYVPGEQPKDGERVIKINTNECPYPPSPKVLEAVTKTADDSLRLYPDSDASDLRRKLAELYYSDIPDFDETNVFLGNGSDEVLALAFKAFFDDTRAVSFPDITYSFYPVYCKLFGIKYNIIPILGDMRIDVDSFVSSEGGVIFPNPNAPTSMAIELSDIEKIAASHKDSVVIIDEAYVDFGAQSAVKLLSQCKNLLVIQTMSKSRALAGMRIGYALGSRELIVGLERVKNSFNSYPLDRIAIAAGCAAVDDDVYYRNIAKAIISTRERTTASLRELGFRVLPSAANFIFTSPPDGRAADFNAFLRSKSIIARYFNNPKISDFIRISIGTDEEMDCLIKAAREYYTKGSLT